MITQKKNMNAFIHQGHVKLMKSDSKAIYNVTKDFYFYSSQNFEKM